MDKFNKNIRVNRTRMCKFTGIAEVLDLLGCAAAISAASRGFYTINNIYS